MVGAIGHDALDVNEACGILNERKRVEQHGFEPAEHRCVSADAERKRKNGNRGESGILREHPNSVANVLQQCSHPVRPFAFRCRELKLEKFQTHPCAIAGRNFPANAARDF